MTAHPSCHRHVLISNENHPLNLAVTLRSTQQKTLQLFQSWQNLQVSVSATQNRGNCSTHCGFIYCLVYCLLFKCTQNVIALFFCDILHLPSVSTQTVANASLINVRFVNTRTPSEFSSSFHSVSVRAAAYCSINDPPANGGVINRTRLRPGSKLFYYCNRGYRLVGSSNATCRLHPNGLFQWDTPPPLCQGEHKYICLCVCVAHKYTQIYMYKYTCTNIHV